jgi:hypothetical protein
MWPSSIKLEASFMSGRVRPSGRNASRGPSSLVSGQVPPRQIEDARRCGRHSIPPQSLPHVATLPPQPLPHAVAVATLHPCMAVAPDRGPEREDGRRDHGGGTRWEGGWERARELGEGWRLVQPQRRWPVRIPSQLKKEKGGVGDPRRPPRRATTKRRGSTVGRTPL